MAQYLYKRWTGKLLEKREIYKHNLNHYKLELLKHRVNNNIFSVKIFPENHFDYRKTFDTKNTQYIFLHRKDKIAQLISMLALYVTGKPYDNNHISKHIPRIQKLNEREINKYFKLFISQENYWKIFSARLPKEIQTHIFSENIIAEPVSGMMQLSDRFGLEFNPEFTNRQLMLGCAYKQDKELKKSITLNYGAYIQTLFKSKANLFEWP